MKKYVKPYFSYETLVSKEKLSTLNTWLLNQGDKGEYSNDTISTYCMQS